MNCVLFAKMDKVFSLKQAKQNIYKKLEKSGNFVSLEKWEPWKSRYNRCSGTFLSYSQLVRKTFGRKTEVIVR